MISEYGRYYNNCWALIIGWMARPITYCTAGWLQTFEHGSRWWTIATL